MPSEKLSTALSGVSGEYFVAAEMSRRGYIASITLRNTRGVDILATNLDASKSAGIQVKANQSGRPSWVLSKKVEDYYSETLFYVFVALKEGLPDFHIVPSTLLAKQVKADHAHWLRTPGRGGQPHRDNPMRMFTDPDGKYLNRWDLLGLD